MLLLHVRAQASYGTYWSTCICLYKPQSYTATMIDASSTFLFFNFAQPPEIEEREGIHIHVHVYIVHFI